MTIYFVYYPTYVYDMILLLGFKPDVYREMQETRGFHEMALNFTKYVYMVHWDCIHTEFYQQEWIPFIAPVGGL